MRVPLPHLVVLPNHPMRFLINTYRPIRTRNNELALPRCIGEPRRQEDLRFVARDRWMTVQRRGMDVGSGDGIGRRVGESEAECPMSERVFGRQWYPGRP